MQFWKSRSLQVHVYCPIGAGLDFIPSPHVLEGLRIWKLSYGAHLLLTRTSWSEVCTWFQSGTRSPHRHLQRYPCNLLDSYTTHPLPSSHTHCTLNCILSSDREPSMASAFRLSPVLDLKAVSGQAKVQRRLENMYSIKVALAAITSTSGPGPGGYDSH